MWYRAGIVGMVEDERFHHCAIPAPLYGYWFGRLKEAPRFSQTIARSRNSRAGGEAIIFFLLVSVVFQVTPDGQIQIQLRKCLFVFFVLCCTLTKAVGKYTYSFTAIRQILQDIFPQVF